MRSPASTVRFDARELSELITAWQPPADCGAAVDWVDWVDRVDRLTDLEKSADRPSPPDARLSD
jgi:hypothetical protein